MSCTLGQHILGVTAIPVESCTQSVVEPCTIDTEVELVHGLPCKLATYQARSVNSYRACAAEQYASLGAYTVGSQVREVTRYVLVTQRTVRSADLQVVPPAAQWLEELLL